MMLSTAALARPLARVAPAVLVLLAMALAASALIWALHVPRFIVLSEASYGDFWNRRGWMWLHAVGGTVPLFIGPFLLWSGLARWRPRVHRWMGRTYLLVGSANVGAGAVLSLMARAEPRAIYVATFTLALAWFGAAFMAYRAIRNRQVAEHRDWVIRSYVLTFTFVACRMAMRLPMVAAGGAEAVVATVWVSWIIPLVVTEIALHWRRTGRAS